MKDKLHKDCPGFEELSAYFDNELDSSSLEYKHIEKCDICKRELEGFKIVSDSIKKELQLKVPDDFAREVIAGIKKRNEAEKVVKSFPLKGIMRTAALFIITSLIIIDLLPIDRNQKLHQKVQAKAEPLIFLNKLTDSNHLTSFQNIPSRSYAAGANDAIDLRKMINVSTGSSPSEFISIPNGNREHTAVIPPVVHQVWSVDNLSDVHKQIQQLSPHAKLASNARDLTMRGKLTKKEVAEFVRNCKQKGFRLLSPTQPQPEQQVFLGNPNDKISYSATFVKPE